MTEYTTGRRGEVKVVWLSAVEETVELHLCGVRELRQIPAISGCHGGVEIHLR